MYVSPWVYWIFGAVCQRGKVRRPVETSEFDRQFTASRFCVMFNSGISPSRNWEYCATRVAKPSGVAGWLRWERTFLRKNVFVFAARGPSREHSGRWIPSTLSIQRWNLCLFSVLPVSCRRKGKRPHKNATTLAEPPHAHASASGTLAAR
jgi:hypothetical protein